MSLRRSRIAFAAVMSSSLLAGLAVAESSGATTPDTTLPGTAEGPVEPEATTAATVEVTPARCPNPEGGAQNHCLGPLDPGEYTTTMFEPTLTYSVPEGWSNLEDLRGNFLLLPPGGTLEGVNAGTSDYLGVYTSVVPPGHCNGEPSTTVPHTFDGLVKYLTSNEAIAVSNRHDVSVGGLSGVAMDLEMAGTTGDGCPDGVWADIYVGTDPSRLVHSIIPIQPVRLYLLHYGSGVLAIELGDHISGGSDFTDWYSAAAPVIDSFAFDTSGIAVDTTVEVATTG